MNRTSFGQRDEAVKPALQSMCMHNKILQALVALFSTHPKLLTAFLNRNTFLRREHNFTVLTWTFSGIKRYIVSNK
jgi:hypothetical protein